MFTLSSPCPCSVWKVTGTMRGANTKNDDLTAKASSDHDMPGLNRANAWKKGKSACFLPEQKLPCRTFVLMFSVLEDELPLIFRRSVGRGMV